MTRPPDKTQQADDAGAAEPPRQQKQSLRERKKSRTKEAIQRHALRLFQEQGYAATTIEHIAAAAEVAPSTVFRYFAGKEDLVTFEPDLAPLLDEFRKQPAHLGLIEAFRQASQAVYGAMNAEKLALERENQLRELSIVAMPELWATNLVGIQTAVAQLADAVAERTGNCPNNLAVQSFVGAYLGALAPVWFQWARDSTIDLTQAIDNALAQLQNGSELSSAPGTGE